MSAFPVFINGAPEAESLGDDDLFPLVVDGATSKVKASTLGQSIFAVRE